MKNAAALPIEKCSTEYSTIDDDDALLLLEASICLLVSSELQSMSLIMLPSYKQRRTCQAGQQLASCKDVEHAPTHDGGVTPHREREVCVQFVNDTTNY